MTEDLDKEGSSHLETVLASMYRAGHRVVAANMVAERMWPDGRRHNARGQTFHLGAAVAARMLRRSRMVVEVEWRRWEILPPDQLEPLPEAVGSKRQLGAGGDHEQGEHQ